MEEELSKPEAQASHTKTDAPIIEAEEPTGANSQPKREKHYGPRTCRICLEVIQPSFEMSAEGIMSGVLPQPRVQYISEDPSSGRLIRPCKCKGSQSYVHEGCLQEWRHADPGYGRRNYFECPTCKYAYRLERMRWSQWIGSTSTQVALTLAILLMTVFLLGFVADPIFNLYLDPVSTIAHPIEAIHEPALVLEDGEQWTWWEHLLKGLASLGLLGFIKVVFGMAPWHWHNIRNVVPGGGRGRRMGGAGRDRLESISWHLVLIGVIAFSIVSLFLLVPAIISSNTSQTAWQAVRAWSRRTLEKAGERVVDVHGEEDDEDDEPAVNPGPDTSESLKSQ